MLRNFMDPPLPLFVQEDCALMHASRFCHCIPLVEHVFKTAARPALFQINSLNIPWTIFTTLCSVPLYHLMVGVAITRARSPDSCAVPWPTGLLTTWMSFQDLEILILYVVWQASLQRALSWTAVLGAESCLPIWKSAAGSMGLDRKPGWLNTQVQDQRRL